VPHHENVWGSGSIIPQLLIPQFEVGYQLHSLVALSPGRELQSIIEYVFSAFE